MIPAMISFFSTQLRQALESLSAMIPFGHDPAYFFILNVKSPVAFGRKFRAADLFKHILYGPADLCGDGFILLFHLIGFKDQGKIDAALGR